MSSFDPTDTKPALFSATDVVRLELDATDSRDAGDLHKAFPQAAAVTRVGTTVFIRLGYLPTAKDHADVEQALHGR